jgi:UDP-4-amino-4-deoxy-L-arabinose-oxoglutarate aminotransferase
LTNRRGVGVEAAPFHPPDRRESFLPFSRPTLGPEEEQEVLDTLRSGWITSGPRVQEFEARFRERLGARHAIAVNSATAGLHLALATLDLRPDDEVIVPAITWPSTANVVELCGGRTVFADVDADTLCLDPADTSRRVTDRTRAIVPVHFAGQPVDLAAFRVIADERGLLLVEDAAHALGTRYDGVEIGARSEIAVFSFHPNKNMTTGEGGMIVCRDGGRAERMRRLRFHGVSRDSWKRFRRGGTPQYDVAEPGWKYNMLDLQAALGLPQLRKLDDFNERRRECAERYTRLLVDVPEIRPLSNVPWPATHAWHLYVVRLDLDAVTLDRDEFQAALQAENIGTGLHYPALHLRSYYRRDPRHTPGPLPGAEQADERIFSLPLYPLLDEQDQLDVVHALCRVIAAHRG